MCNEYENTRRRQQPEIYDQTVFMDGIIPKGNSPAKPPRIEYHPPAPTAYSTVRKAGRCFNGFEADGGKIIHLIYGKAPHGDWFGKALCNAEPGYRGNGWSLDSRPASCPKCIEKLRKIKDRHPITKEPLDTE